MTSTQTTPTGIPVTLCGTCGHVHPVTRNHCTECGSPSAFQKDGVCIGCKPAEAR